MFHFSKNKKKELSLAIEKLKLLEKENHFLKQQLSIYDDSLNKLKEWDSIYHNFDHDDYNNKTIHNLNKESGWIRGEIVHSIHKIPNKISSLLLPGEPNELKKTYSSLLKIPEDSIKTTGLHNEVDYTWNFEKPPPDLGTFDLIVSQAMLEHLIDPFKHMKDLSEFLNKNGHIIMHTVIPGFPYHRYPIDCMRFYPDWFETVADRLSLEITYKFIGEQRILYSFKKTEIK